MIKSISWYIAVTVYALILAFPFLWMVSTAFKPTNEIHRLQPSFIPETPTIEAFVYVLTETQYLMYLKNSLVVSVATTVISVLFAAMAGYAFSRIRFKIRSKILSGFLAAQMIPGVILIIPIYFILLQLQLTDTYIGLILTYVSFALPFSTWIMTGYYKSLPRELEEAAFIDGASRMQAFIKVILPLSTPGLMSVGIFAFILSWDEFLFALTLTSTESMRTLPYGLYSFMSQYGIQWNQLMAASIITMVVPMLIFIFLHRYFIKGFTAGAVKE
ncbi:carbohydrate ABC transporter permease [Caldalkalibacillus salinus]|uniref:carbohydrate ABC transporter permease n=1 Tax=Caldalkalibacillus salinus TaxID=2803787 RepID=UPI0019240591|nr:carbohydrate ABC transporter permease [Caldalkalibacillus salinus]